MSSPGGNGPRRCALCEKTDHEAIKCPKRKGCSKCKTPATHSAEDCKLPGSDVKKDYPPHDQQVCDACLQPGHEAKDFEKCQFPNFFGVGSKTKGAPHCKFCGHGGFNHQANKKKKSNPCALQTLFQTDPHKARDQMTPYFYLQTQIPANLPGNTPPSVPASIQQTPNVASSAATPTVGSITQGIQSIRLTSSRASAQEKADKQKLYDRAELNIAKPLAQTQEEQGNALPSGPKIKANFYEIELNPGIELHRYTIELGTFIRTINGVQRTVAITNREAKRYLIGTLLNDLTSTPRPLHSNWATDYNSTIISVDELFQNSARTDLQATQVVHPRTGSGGQNVMMTSQVIYRGRVRTDLLRQHLNASNHVAGSTAMIMNNGTPYDPSEDLKALNIITWKDINDDNIFRDGGRHGNKFYPRLNQEAADEQNANLYMIRTGFFTSVRPGQNSILLNVNVATSAFYSPILMQTWLELATGLTPRDRKIKVKDVRVVFDVRNSTYPPKHYTIHDIGQYNVLRTTFHLDTANPQKSVYDYMTETYQGVSFDPDAFCLNAGGPSRDTWVPADKCKILDWQVVTGLLDENNSRVMVETATKRPQVCKNLIKNHALPRLGIQPLKPFYRTFGLTPKTEMVQLISKTLHAPALIFGQQTATVIVKAGWNFREDTIYQGANNASLPHCINFSAYVNDHKLENLCNMLVKHNIIQGLAKGRHKIIVEKARMPQQVNHTFRQNCTRELNNALTRLKAKLQGRTPPLIIVVLPGKDRQFYPEVKRWGDCENGIPTVCILQAKINDASPDLLANLCLKVNLKLRGVNHQIHVPPEVAASRPSTTVGAPRNTMIVGADVTHPGKGSEGCPSMAAVVATNDDNSYHYLGSARLQRSKDEFIHDMRGMMKERVRAWHKKAKANGATAPDQLLPFHILFYRDGVSESQFGMALHEELPKIYEGCQEALGTLSRDTSSGIPANHTWVPKVTLIVVTKRHHARFMLLKDVRAGDKFTDINLAAGTIADTHVVTPNHWSFYLQSHYSPLGTSRNGHYVVLHDDFGYRVTTLQAITNRICFTGARAAKGLSVATPARYADFLCDRLRNYMNPVYAGRYTVTPSSGPTTGANGRPIPGSPDDHANNREVWSTTHTTGERKNPWHPNMDDIMFYL